MTQDAEERRFSICIPRSLRLLRPLRQSQFMFNKLLIEPNRGEIACRVEARPPAVWACAPSPSIPRPTPMRAVRLADEAVHRPGGRARIYLVVGQDHRCRQRTGAQAIHPGYGFSPRTPTSPSPARTGHRLHRPTGAGDPPRWARSRRRNR